MAAALQAAALPGVRDVVSTYRTVAVHFDPLRTDYSRLVERIETEARSLGAVDAAGNDPIPVPVCYGGEFGPDLDAVAAFGGITAAEAVRIHTAPTYRVFMLGFLPGFTYMGTVDERIAAPRLSTPRVSVAPGSVGIAGAQTGIYPLRTPGGWCVVGRTPLRPFDLKRGDPFMFKPGDAVRFEAVDAAEYNRLEQSR
jgi:KipI family sensor histidine kinase inhibitor